VILVDLLPDVVHLAAEPEPGGEPGHVGQVVGGAVLAPAARVVDLAVERLAELARVRGLVEPGDGVERAQGLERRGQQLGARGEELRVAVVAVEFTVGDEGAEDDEAALERRVSAGADLGGLERGARARSRRGWTAWSGTSA
jgi:hypothetical protein